MKHYVCIAVLLILFSCAKEEQVENVEPSTQLVGRWLEVSNFGDQIFIKTYRFGDFEKGLVFFDDGTMIGRSESSVCIGENCLMENYDGTWILEKDSKLNIEVESLKGLQSYKAEIIKLTSDSLVMRTKF